MQSNGVLLCALGNQILLCALSNQILLCTQKDKRRTKEGQNKLNIFKRRTYLILISKMSTNGYIIKSVNSIYILEDDSYKTITPEEENIITITLVFLIITTITMLIYLERRSKYQFIENLEDDEDSDDKYITAKISSKQNIKCR